MSQTLRKYDSFFMDKAHYYATRSRLRYRHGACIGSKSYQIHGWGWNVDVIINRDWGGDDTWTLHAEAHAIYRAYHMMDKIDPATLTLYSARVGKNNYDRKISKPCDHCMNMIKSIGIGRIVYTDSLGNPTAMIIRP